MTRFKVRDRVTPVGGDARVPAGCVGRTFVVTKRNPKNVRCEAEDGGRGINFPDELLLPATDENVTDAVRAQVVPPEHFSVGEIVTLKKAWKSWTPETPLVVLGGGNRLNVTRVGGDGDRYLRTPPQSLVRRDRKWLAAALWAAGDTPDPREVALT